MATARYIRTEKLGKVKPGSLARFSDKIRKKFSYLVQNGHTLPQKEEQGQEKKSPGSSLPCIILTMMSHMFPVTELTVYTAAGDILRLEHL